MSPCTYTYIRRDVFTLAGGSGRDSDDGLISRSWTPHPLQYVLNPSEALAGGSREHYFHFLLGYLLPLIHCQTAAKLRYFQVVDCGPVMTPILVDTLNRIGFDFDVVDPANLSQPFFVPAWDYRWANKQDVIDICRLIAGSWLDYVCGGEGCETHENLLLQRSQPNSFYTEGSAEVKGYGTSRRSIINLSDISEALRLSGVSHMIYEPGQHCLGCQIKTFARADRIYGIRGAEWANAVWAKAGLRARILDPVPPAVTLSEFLTRCNVHYEICDVSNHHVVADPESAIEFFSAA